MSAFKNQSKFQNTVFLIGRHSLTFRLICKHHETEKVTFKLFFSNSKLSLASEVKLYVNHQAWEVLGSRQDRGKRNCTLECSMS